MRAGKAKTADQLIKKMNEKGKVDSHQGGEYDKEQKRNPS